MQLPGEADYPVEIRGFVTDPKAVGFQVLTNYESTYVRAYVGNDAWGLYEVLRSFCHDGNNTCHPSINFLLSILGIKQRRVLTGWTTNVKGKQYTYPGLIEILQQAELLIAEMDDQGPNQRYIFHVNLTPGMLTPQQVATLPPLMQTKHSELIQRHLDTLAELERKRRPPKVSPDAPSNAAENLQNPLQEGGDSPNLIGESGSDKLSDPMTNCREGGDKLSQPPDNLSPKQQPINNTHKTSDRASRSINNNRGATADGSNQNQNNQPPAADPEQTERHAVVVALLEQGMAEKVAQRLGEKYRPERIREKIDYVTYLQEEDPGRIKNPRGWLRRAIEENYGPPDGYAPPEERGTRQSRAAAERRRQYLPDEYLPYLANAQGRDTASDAQDDPADGAAHMGHAEHEDRDQAAATAQAAPTPAARDAEGEQASTDEARADEARADDPMAVDMSPTALDAATQDYVTPPAASGVDPSGAGAANGPGSLTRAARRTMLQRDYGVTSAAQSFWETALHDLRYTTPPDFFELVADVEIVALTEGAVHLAVWDEENYRRLQHPGLQKALGRDLGILARRKLQVVVEFWGNGDGNGDNNGDNPA